MKILIPLLIVILSTVALAEDATWYCDSGSETFTWTTNESYSATQYCQSSTFRTFSCSVDAEQVIGAISVEGQITSYFGIGCPDGCETARCKKSCTEEYCDDEFEERTYYLNNYTYQVAAPTQGEDLPLVIGLHGGGGDIASLVTQSDFTQKAKNEGFVIAYPQGNGRFGGTWNAGRCCGDAMQSNHDDVGFLSAMIEKISVDYPIDTNRVFVMGHSNGAHMARRLACDVPELVTAVGYNAGHDAYECEENLPVIGFHGTQDGTALFLGGQCGRFSNSYWDCRPVMDFYHDIAMGNGCDVNPINITYGDTTCYTYENCDQPTKYCVVDEGGHTWPGGEYAINKPWWRDRMGHLTQDITATDVMWEFFQEVS